MTYETIATISQVTSLLLFITLFFAILAYALWPKNQARFEAVQRRALDLDAAPAPVARDAGSAAPVRAAGVIRRPAHVATVAAPPAEAPARANAKAEETEAPTATTAAE